jgi:pimeloyl-ACP methyl ester carboxylesterase
VPAVFVHGVPDTSEMWDPLLAKLDRSDVVTLRLPGFGEPVPAGFGCTMNDYAAWVATQLGGIDEPVDLVGHDWGSLITQRVAITKPELLRTFTQIDAAITDAFTWHDLATQWQTPGVGEQIMELMTPDAVAAAIGDAGHPDAKGAAARVDETMKSAILKLYRSATNIAAEWSPTGPSERPGLVLWGADDAFGKPESGERVSGIYGAKFVLLNGGHWAVIEHPNDSAAALAAFWTSV